MRQLGEYIHNVIVVALYTVYVNSLLTFPIHFSSISVELIPNICA